MVLRQQILGFLHCNVQHTSHLVDAHAIHDAEVHGLCILTRDVSHVSHHLVEVCIISFVTLNHFINARVTVYASDRRTVVSQPAWLL